MTSLYDTSSGQYRRVSEPVISVRVLGPNARFAPILDGRIMNLKVNARTGRMAKAELLLWNEDGKLTDNAALSKGTRLRIQWGYSGWLSKPREFRIKKIKGSRAKVRNLGRITLECYDRSESLHGSKRSNTYKNLTDNEIVSVRAKFYGLKTFLGPDDGIRRSRIQSNQTDAQFLAGLAQKKGYIFAVQNDTLVFAPRSLVEAEAPMAAYTYFADGVGKGWVMHFDPDGDVLALPGAVRVISRDPKTKKRVEATATVRTRKDRSLGRWSELVEDPNPDARVPLATSSDGDTPHTETVTVPGLNQAQAQQEAEKRLAYRQSTGIKARAGFIGNPDAWSDQLLVMFGLAKSLQGVWRCTEVEHEIGARGYLMQMRQRRDGLAAIPRGLSKRKVQQAKSVKVAVTTRSPLRRQSLPVTAQSGVRSRTRLVRR